MSLSADPPDIRTREQYGRGRIASMVVSWGRPLPRCVPAMIRPRAIVADDLTGAAALAPAARAR
jgi:hypothetical protein